MRKTTEKVVSAFLEGKARKVKNTWTDGKALFLFGHKIAEFRHDGIIKGPKLYITNAGYGTVTTRERLNALPNVSVYQKNYVQFLNGKEWDGEWIKID